MMLFAFFMTLEEIVLSLEYDLFVMKDFLVSQINHKGISLPYIIDPTWVFMFIEFTKRVKEIYSRNKETQQTLQVIVSIQYCGSF